MAAAKRETAIIPMTTNLAAFFFDRLKFFTA
jgi:hypothetical protein